MARRIKFQSGMPPRRRQSCCRLAFSDPRPRTEDAAVPFSMSEEYQKQAVERGDSARLIALPNVGHFELINPESKEWAEVVATLG